MSGPTKRKPHTAKTSTRVNAGADSVVSRMMKALSIPRLSIPALALNTDVCLTSAVTKSKPLRLYLGELAFMHKNITHHR